MCDIIFKVNFMYCRKCGHEIPDRHTYCPFCGADQRKETTSFTTMLDIKEIKKNKITKTKKNIVSTASWFTCVLSLIALVFAILIFRNINVFAWLAIGFSALGLIVSFIGIKATNHNVRKGAPLAYSGLAINLICLLFVVVVLLLNYFYK